MVASVEGYAGLQVSPAAVLAGRLPVAVRTAPLVYVQTKVAHPEGGKSAGKLV